MSAPDSSSVLKINGKEFVVGLRWEALKSSLHFMREARAFGKANGMDIVVIREGIVLQGGFISKKAGVTKDMYSVASVLTDVLGDSWLAVFQLDEDRFYLVAAEKSAVILGSDIIGNEELIRNRVLELNAQFGWPDEKIIAPDAWSFGGVERRLEEFLTNSNVQKKHRLKQLTFGLSKKEWIRYGSLAVVLCAVGVVALWYHDTKTKEKLARIEQINKQRQLELERLSEEQRSQIASSALTRPWTLKPRASSMLPLCEEAIYSLPLTIGGWIFQKAQCEPNKLSAFYKRSEGTTNLDFLREFSYVFDRKITAELQNDDIGAFQIPMRMPAGGDEFSSMVNDARNLFVSHFQRVEHAVRVEEISSEIILPSILPDGSPWPEDAPAPLPIWTTYAFVFESADKPSSAMSGLNEDGIRVAIIEATLKDDASFSWKTVGEIYGSL